LEWINIRKGENDIGYAFSEPSVDWPNATSGSTDAEDENQIVRDADLWIQLKEKFIYIRYFAVRDDEDTFRGTLEVSQDITDIRSLQGERRLLNWDVE